MNKRILYVRSAPFDLNMNTYNVQEVGLGQAFCRAGYDFDLISFSKRKRGERVFYKYKDCRAKCIEIGRFRLSRMGINLEICKKKFLNQYDIIISSEYFLQTYLLSLKSRNICMYFGPYYNLFVLPFSSVIYDAIFTKSINRHVKHKFAKSNLAKSYLEDKGYSGIKTVGVGLDTERFENVAITKSTQNLVAYMKQNRCLLYVGALSDRKNFPFLLKVFQALVKKYPSLKLVVIGKSVQNPIKRLFGKSNNSYANDALNKLPEIIRKNILWKERVDNPQLKFIYPLAKAFLLPSKQEIFGMVLLEAMYLGSPVVTSRNGGSVTLIKNNITGQIVDYFDIDQWSDAVSKYLDNSTYATDMVEKAHWEIKNEFNWDVIVKKMLGDF